MRVVSCVGGVVGGRLPVSGTAASMVLWPGCKGMRICIPAADRRQKTVCRRCACCFFPLGRANDAGRPAVIPCNERIHVRLRQAQRRRPAQLAAFVFVATVYHRRTKDESPVSRQRPVSPAGRGRHFSPKRWNLLDRSSAAGKISAIIPAA